MRLPARLLFVCVFAACPALAAAEDWYEVELIVFRHTSENAGLTETWPLDAGRPRVDDAVDLIDPVPGPVLPLTRLAPEPRRLEGTWQALGRSSRYQPLAYWSWIQPGFERGSEVPVRLSLPGSELVPEAGPVDEDGFPVLGEAAAAPPPVPPLRLPLDGSLALGLQRYLYAQLDLVFSPEGASPVLQMERAPESADPVETAPAEGEADAAPQTAPVFTGFRLRETRRLRSKEVHYFDHPVFGAILLVTPRPMPDIAPVR